VKSERFGAVFANVSQVCWKDDSMPVKEATVTCLSQSATWKAS